MVDAVEEATPAAVLVPSTVGVDVATGGVVEAAACVLVAVEVIELSHAPPPEIVVPAVDGRENGCNTVSQLLPDAATTA